MRTRAALIVLAIASLSVAQAPAPAAGKNYHSDAFGFDFTYPAGFIDSRPAQTGVSPNADCVTNPVELTNMTSGFNLISLRQYDEVCLKKKGSPPMTLGPAVTGLLMDSLSHLGKPVMSSTANYYLAGHNASTVSGIVKLSQASNQAIFGAGSCVSSDKGIFCFLFLANDCSSLAALSSSTVKFLGTVASPAIPVGIGTACQAPPAATPAQPK